MTLTVLAIDPRFHLDDLGFIPSFLDDNDPRKAAEQFHQHYAHGGGWRPQSGFERVGDTPTLIYPGDPPFKPLAMIDFRDEAIFLYPCAYVGIFQPDGSFEVCRMD